MKILYVIPDLGQGGAERLVLNIINGLNVSDLDTEIKLVIFNDTNKYKNLAGNIDLVCLPIQYKSKFFGKVECENIHLFDQLIADFKPDIIHSHLTIADIICRINPVDSAVYVSHLHGANSIIEPKLSMLFSKEGLLQLNDHYLINKLFVKSSTRLIAISNSVYKSFKRDVAKPLKNGIVILFNCIDFKSFLNPNPRVFPKVPGKVQFVNCGRTIHWKNQTVLIDVIDRLVNDEKITNIHLNILGDGALKTELQEKVDRLKLNEYISLKGSIPNVERYYWDSDIYLHSAIDGIFGLSTLEALSSGLPLVANAGPNEGEGFIKNEVHGAIIQDNNLDDFITGIKRMISDKEWYNSVSSNNINLAEQYSVENYVGKLYSIYEDFLKDKKE